MNLRYLSTIRQPDPTSDSSESKFPKITALAFSPNNVRLAVASVDKYILLFDENGEMQDRFPTKSADNKKFLVKSMDFSPDSTKLALAQTDNIVFVFKLGEKFGDKKSICNKFPQTSPVTCLCWPKQQPNMIVFGTAEGKVRAGLISSNKSTTLYSHDSHVVSISVSPDGNSFVAGHLDGSIFRYIFDDPDGKYASSQLLLLQSPFVPYGLSWGESVAVAGNSSKVLFVNPQNGQTIQAFDYSKDPKVKEFTCASFSPSGQTLVLGNFNRFHTYAFNPSKKEWIESPACVIENLYTVTAVRWRPDGSRVCTGSLGGYVDLYDACLKRYVHANLFEFTYTSLYSVLVKKLANSFRFEFRASNCSEIRKIGVHLDRFIVAQTTDSLILADSDSGLVSEISWNSALPKFYFENPSVAMLFHAGELTLVEYGTNRVLGACRTEYTSSHCISVRICPARKGQDENENIKRIAYLLDLQTIRVLDLKSSLTVTTMNLDTKIDWLELNSRGTKLLFRDKRQTLHIYDIASEVRTTLLNFCNYVQWVPESDVVVAQNRNTLCIWYSIENPDQVTSLPIKGEVEEIERSAGKTNVIVEEGNGVKKLYPLDETLISFGAAVEDADFERAVEILESTGSNSAEAPALWNRLSLLSLDSGNFVVAERCFAALGDVSKSRFLNEINSISSDPKHPLVQARIAMLHKQFKRAEAILMEQGRTDDAILMYKGLFKWDEAVSIAEQRGHPLASELRSQYYEWLTKTSQEEKAGLLKEHEGDYLSAINLYLRGGHPVKAANLISSQRIMHDAALLDRVASSLLKCNQYERAGEFFESLERLERALEAYTKGHCYKKAVELARKSFRGNVVRLEEEWGDWLASQKRWDDASNHYIEAGAPLKAVAASIDARQWSKATQILESLDSDSAKPYFAKVALHFAESKNYRLAERYFLQGGMPHEVVKMYTEANMMNEARKIAENTLSQEEISELYEQQASQFELAGKFAEAERLYLEIRDVDSAISMYKKHRMYEKMLALVSLHRKELLTDTHLLLAHQFESENNLKLAEQYFVLAKDWTGAVNMYRDRGEWDDAFRVAKSHGGVNAQKQVAYACAVTVGGDAGVKLLEKRGLVEMVIDYAMERKQFDEAFSIAEQACKSKIPDIHKNYGIYLEDTGYYAEAEEQFLKAGQYREALEMYLCQHDWTNAVRIAENFDGGVALPEVWEAQANEELERKDYKNAENHFIQAKKPELAIKMFKDVEKYEDAIRLAKIYIPHVAVELQSELNHRVRENQKTEAAAEVSGVSVNSDVLLAPCKQFMKTGRFSEAIDAYLKITSKQTSDVSLLCRCWENAANVAIEQVSSRISEVVPLVCKRLVSIEKFDSAANIYLSIDAFAEAIDMYLAAKNYAKAKTIAQTSAPHLLSFVEQSSRGSSTAKSSTIESSGNQQLDQLAARGEWVRLFEIAHSLNDFGLLHRFASIYATKLLASNSIEQALSVFVKHGASVVQGNIPLYRQIVKGVFQDRRIDHDEEISENFNNLRELLFKLLPDLKESKLGAAIVKEFERYMLISYYLAMKYACKVVFPKLYSKLCVSLLRYTNDVAVDSAFYDAGVSCRDNNQLGMAFVFFNRFTDVCDMIDNANADSDNIDFAGTDIPVSPDLVPLPTSQVFSTETREEIREWVVDQAISNHDSNSQSLTTISCENCNKPRFECNLVCHSCKSESTACIVTGYPVLKQTKVNCKSCKMAANRDDWNTYVVKQKTCPWCGNNANPVETIAMVPNKNSIKECNDIEFDLSKLKKKKKKFGLIEKSFNPFFVEAVLCPGCDGCLFSCFKDTIQVRGCTRVTSIPYSTNLVYLLLYACPLIRSIEPYPNLDRLLLNNCNMIEYLPKLPSLTYLDCSGCSLMTKWKGTDKLNDFSGTFNGAYMLHVEIKLFNCIKGTLISEDYTVYSVFRKRNGISLRFLSAFLLCKVLYLDEIPSRVYLEVYRNKKLYAPGGLKYLSLVEKYKDGIFQ